MIEKKEIRRQVLAIRDALTAREIEDKSRAVVSRLTGLAEVEQSVTLMVFLAFGNEVNLDGLIQWGWSRRKRIVVPYCHPGEGTLAAYRISSFAELDPGFYGIRAPRPGELRPVPPAEVDAVIVPGVAFDRRGCRIGYGGGYYDRFLGEAAYAARIGAAFACQIVPEIPQKPHDISVDAIATEAETIVAAWGRVNQQATDPAASLSL
ncbi:MAG: 5-formyltetrahydrofolate cyclo-ligase [Syntrophaceae bacterium]|nr:5-formyltetrahydrofolate cyclo-ligase [Syntrophaceae bacterium]